MIILRILIAVLLAQLSSCASLLREMLPYEQEPQASVGAASNIATATPLWDGALVTAGYSTRGPNAVDINVETARVPQHAEIPPLRDVDASWRLVKNGHGFWFSRIGTDAEGPAAWFVIDGAVRRVAVRPPLSVVAWLPVPGEKPRGLLLTAGDAQPSLHVVEVAPEGTNRLADLEWWQTTRPLEEVVPSQWSAEELRDNAFAIVAVDGPPDDRRLRLRILRERVATQHDLPCKWRVDQPVRTATTPDGTLGIAGRSEAGEVIAFFVDPGQPSGTRCQRLTLPGERVADVPFLHGSVDVIGTGDRFVVSWIREDGAVRAAEFRSANAPPVVLTIAGTADTRSPLRQMLSFENDRITFTWRDRSGEIAARSLPKDLTWYTLGLELRASLDRVFATPGSQQSPRP